MFEWIRHWRYGNQYGYETYFRHQERHPLGKPGIILSDLGMPEKYEPDFYVRFMEHVFDYSLPKFLLPIVMADRGIALIDPGNPLAREPFVPNRLIDMYGSFTNSKGQPYTDCQVTWRRPGMSRNPADHGYFLYKGDGKSGVSDVCQKTAAKVAGWYFGHLLPEKKIAWEHQCRLIYGEAVAVLQKAFPQAVFRHARYIYEESLSQAVEELIASGCETIIYQCFCNPVYCDFEDYAFTMPKLHRLVNGRARIIYADQLGNQPSLREAFTEILRDQLVHIPRYAKILLILSKHGHPFRKETQDIRGPEYRLPLEVTMRNALTEWGGTWDLVWSNDEYADDYWDPGKKKLSTYSAYRQAIENRYDFALEIPTDFIAENTDLMILHALKKFRAFGAFDANAPVHYPDWEQPLVRKFRENLTTGIYAGCPVGKYRKYVVRAVADSVSETLRI